ncbi:MAG: hypothetical protein EOM54_14790 [Clostridia bacterium]|nr:hypothetical protein [Clostridia bacterium]
MNREEAIEILKDSYERLAMLAHGGLYPDEREELRKAFEALFNLQPDPITGLVPCEYCTDHKNLYDDKYTDVEMLDGFIHTDVRTQYEGWSFGFYINYCPMCGRKLTAPPLPGAIGPDADEMAPNGDEGARE